MNLRNPEGLNYPFDSSKFLYNLELFLEIGSELRILVGLRGLADHVHCGYDLASGAQFFQFTLVDLILASLIVIASDSNFFRTNKSLF